MRKAVAALFLAWLLALAGSAQAGPPRADLWRLWSRYYVLERNQPERAAQVLNQILTLAPSEARVWKTLGYSRLRAGNKRGALEAFGAARRLAPSDEELQVQIAYLEAGLGESLKARRDFSRLISSRNKAIAAKARAALALLQPLPSASDRAYALWSRYYALEKSRPSEADAVLRQILSATPDSIRAWKTLGYLRLRQGDKTQALAAFRRAEKLAPHDEALQFQIAYLEVALEQNQAAYQRFGRLAHSSDRAYARKARVALRYLGPTVSSLLPRPYFADLYFSPSYESRFHLNLLPAKLRLGRRLNLPLAPEIYLFGAEDYDSRSAGGKVPAIFGQDAAALGVGLDIHPLRQWPIAAYLEVGARYDLVNRMRPRWREHVTAVLAGFQAWGLPEDCCDGAAHLLLTPYADLYGSLGVYSYDDYSVIAQTRLRGGLNLAQGPWGLLQAYLRMQLTEDTLQHFYNDTVDVGPGLAWWLPTRIPLVLRVESLWGHYLNGRNNPYPPNYTNERVELDFFWSF